MCVCVCVCTAIYTHSSRTQKSALPAKKTVFFLLLAPRLHFTTHRHPDGHLSRRKCTDGTQKKIKKILVAPMTPTSSFTSCLLGITDTNHLHYSAFYSGVRTLQILRQWHRHISRHHVPTCHT